MQTGWGGSHQCADKVTRKITLKGFLMKSLIILSLIVIIVYGIAWWRFHKIGKDLKDDQ